jgi:hypothetical protein
MSPQLTFDLPVHILRSVTRNSLANTIHYEEFMIYAVLQGKMPACLATLNQHPPEHHPLDACHYSVVDEPQLS